MKRMLGLAAVLAAVCSLPQVAAGDSPPPGATARCKDGTYSYSQTHSGTCSHHGGVAEWLDGSAPATTTTTAPPPATTTTAPPPATSTSTTTTTAATTTTPPATTTTPLPPTAAPRKSGAAPAVSFSVGTTVLLARRTKTSSCTLGANPDRRCSPGAYYSKLTLAVICSANFRTSTIRNVPESEKFAVEREYGLAAKHYGSGLEIDHIVSLELGGSNDIANLYPEKAVLPGGAPGFHVKDKLENKVHDLVCAGDMTLRAAQRQIAANWQALYEKVYGMAP